MKSADISADFIIVQVKEDLTFEKLKDFWRVWVKIIKRIMFLRIKIKVKVWVNQKKGIKFNSNKYIG